MQPLWMVRRAAGQWKNEIFALMGGAKQTLAMTQRDKTLQAGSRYFTGSREICNEVFKRDYEFAKWQTRTWNIKCPEGYAITWFEIRSHWTDGTNGTFTIKKEGISTTYWRSV